MDRTILIIEDDPRLGGLIKDYLEARGFSVTWETNGSIGLSRAKEMDPDLIVLDQMLPGLTGIEVCQRVRTSSKVPVIMLTSLRDELEQVVALEAGADDYVIKPCAPRVLLARIRALLRRSDVIGVPFENDTAEREDRISVGALVVDMARRQMTVLGRVVKITSSELELAWLLASNAGQVLSRDVLSVEVRGVRYDGLDRGIDIHVSRLRRKLSDAGLKDVIIEAIRGEGYQLTLPLFKG